MSTNVEFDEIMGEITGSLSGDSSEDIRYLMKVSKEYKNHKYGKEILRACGRMIYELSSEELKEEFNSAIKSDPVGIDAAIEEARHCIVKSNYVGAAQILKTEVANIEKMEMFKDDSVSEYKDFDEPMEYYLYITSDIIHKEIRPAPKNISLLYGMYGSVLIDLKKYDEAKDALLDALHWNPMSMMFSFEYAEILKLTKKLEAFKQRTCDLFKIAFRREHIARCYRNLGYYFIEKEIWDAAIVCHFLGGVFTNAKEDDKSFQMMQNELLYIQQKLGHELDKPSMKEIQRCGYDYAFPLMADKEVLELALKLAKDGEDEEDLEKAVYFYEIVYGLTEDRELWDKIKMLRDIHDNRIN